MINSYNPNNTKSLNPLLKTISKGSPYYSHSKNNLDKQQNSIENYDVKINLESIHYTGENFGYGWTFVISTLGHHWISTQIQIQRGGKSFVNKDIYYDNVETSFHSLQYLPISFCAQHISGFKAEATLHLNPNSLKHNHISESIYTGLESIDCGFHFHELITLTHEDTQLMFVLNFKITPKNTGVLKN